ncbi:TetR/AcrR family transcriptional regulator [Neorhizobium sp. P12A]|uniref:TetR/AcrR family transcriptional regulator n=1 Tax=Neorhizobium sp. P12A TaxID=2268027 RepID=UPI0011ECFEE5|nr:TetR/AcrR family transcriptional regulator [Neorhizobium sp. P12A]KAA0692543.1 TetR/AcrR family transcriptional regulator [Neorhizobium sp. P12A]
MERRQKLIAEGASSPPVRRPRGRPKAASDTAKRMKIIAEAQKTFETLGYGGTTMDLVASRCKISKQTLYQLFASKLELFVAVMAVHRQSMLALPRAPGADMPIAEELAEIFMIDIDEEAERERWPFIQALILDAQQFPEISEALQTYGVDESRQILADWLTIQRSEGKIDIDDTLSAARMLMDMIFAAMVGPSGHANYWPDRETRSRHLRRCIDVFLNGVRPGR